MHKKISLLALLSCISCCALYAQPNRINGLFLGKPDPKNYMIYYLFYNGVQMIEVDNLTMGMDEARYMDGIRPVSTTWAWHIPRIENAYIFRNRKGEIVKQFNTTTKYSAADFIAPDQVTGKMISHRKRLEQEKATRNIGYHAFYDKFIKANFGDFVFLVKESNKKYGIIDTLGNLAAAAKYDSIEYNSSHYYIKQNGKWGLMNTGFTVVIPPKYRTLGYSRKDTHCACNEKCGLINTQDSILVPFTYDGITTTDSFYIIQHDSTAKVNDTYTTNYKMYGLMDSGFHIITPPKYYCIERADEENIYYVCANRCIGLLDGNTGKELTPCRYSEKPIRLGTGYYRVKITKDYKTTFGFLDTTGRELAEPIYENVSDFFDNVAPVKYNGKWGFINHKGKVIIDYKYDAAALLFDAKRKLIARVKLKGETFYIDMKERRVEGF